MTDTINPKQDSNASSAEVNYPQSVFNGIRKTVGFKCDTGLYSEFKRVAKAKMGSVCRPLECFMVAFLALNKERVNFGETVRIEHLHIERNLRERRKLEVARVSEVSSKEIEDQEFLKKQDKLFRVVLEQWDLHPSREWRRTWIKRAEKVKNEVASAGLVLVLANRGDSYV